MALSLSRYEIGRLAEAQRTLLSPFDHDSTEAWLLSAVGQIKELIGADAGGVQGLDNRFTVSSDYSDDLDHLVRDLAEDLEGQFNVTPRLISLGAWNRRLAYGDSLRSYYRSNYYNDLVVPHRMFDSVGLSVSPSNQPSLDDTLHLVFHHARPGGRRFGARGIQTLRLLYPSFRAGVAGATRLTSLHRATAETMDALRHMFRVYGADGRLVYESPKLTGLLANRSARPLEEVLDGCSTRLKRAKGQEGLPDDVMDTVQTGHGKMSVRTLSAPAGLFSVDPCLMVVVTGRTEIAPDTLRDRHGLTEREAQVAALLKKRRSNREIAEILTISEHTARHHTERVLRKMNVHSRQEVASKWNDEAPA